LQYFVVKITRLCYYKSVTIDNKVCYFWLESCINTIQLKAFLYKMTTNDVHIGEIIKDIVKQKKLTDDEFAALVAMSRQGIRYIYDKKSIHIDQLNMISRALEHNFFKYYAPAEEP